MGILGWTIDPARAVATNFAKWLAGWWRPKESPPPIAGPGEQIVGARLGDVLEIVGTWTSDKPKKFDETGVATSGQFYLREAILDQLDEYAVIVRRMKRADKDAYDLYSRVGAYLMPKDAGFTWDTLSPWWLATRPAFGAVAGGIYKGADADEKKSDAIFPRLWYFEKHKHSPRDVQPQQGADIYVVTAYFDSRWEKWWDKTNGKHGLPIQFAIAVDKDGKMVLLKTLVRRQKTVIAKQGKRSKHSQPVGKNRHEAFRVRKGQAFTIPQTEWCHHDFLRGWAEEHKVDVETFFIKLFVFAANAHENVNASTIRVAATKGDVTAVFAVDVKRTAYFFRDRDVTVGEDGKRKRIFHIVRPHKRIIAGGKVVYPRMHFRGEKQFSWQGYRVSITVPGLHHEMLASFNAHTYYEDDEDLPNEEMAGALETGRKFAGHIEKSATKPNEMPSLGTLKLWANRRREKSIP